MSSIVFHRKSTTLRDVFVYLNDDGTFNTGRVQGDFTLKLSKDGTGNQSTSGVTLAEVSAVNNPGEYSVTIASSAFVAANGTYALVITRTSDPRFTWEQVYVVNDTGSASSTPSSFTSSSGDGRVTDGSSAIENADVYVTSGSTFITQTSTNASGDWGPVYLSDGTFTARVQKSGYTQGTATITVSGGTVTGPGANIALTLGSTANPLSAAQLWAYTRRQYLDQTGTKSDSVIKSVVNAALDMASSERLWPHLLRRSYLSLQTPYSTGTIALTNGDATVTLSSGTFPSWAASGRLLFNNQIVDIDTRTDSTHVELETDWGGDTTSGVSYVLFQNEYDLPDNMWAFHEILPGQRWGWTPDPCSPAEVFEAENLSIYGQKFADCFTVANGMVMMWPYPNENLSVAYTYYARPERLTLDTDIADWDPVHLVLLYRAIDYQLALQIGQIVGKREAADCMASYRDELARVTSKDKEAVEIPAAGTFGRLVDSRGAAPWRRRTT